MRGAPRGSPAPDRPGGYARGIFRRVGLFTDDEIDVRVKARLERQQILRRRTPPDFTFFVHEEVLRSAIAEPQVMHEQLLHLVLISERSQCSIRVVPASEAPYGTFGGAFRLMHYADDDKPLVYLESHTASLFLDDRLDVKVYRATLRNLAALALDREESRALLAQLASDYDRVEESTR